MKRLQLCEPATAPSGKETSPAGGIVAEARRAICKIITDNVSAIYECVGINAPGAGEDYIIEATDYSVPAPHFRVTVSDLMTDYEGIEDRTIATLKVTPDCTPFVEPDEETESEYPADALSIEELAAVADWTSEIQKEVTGEDSKETRRIRVRWDTDGEPVGDLPETVVVPLDVSDENVADFLSDKFGFCVVCWSEI